MTSYVFYLILLSWYPAPSQTSTPIGSEKECISAGEKAVEVFGSKVKFVCVEGAL